MPKKRRLIIKLNICEKSKLSNSVATGKTEFWLITKAFFNSLSGILSSLSPDADDCASNVSLLAYTVEIIPCDITPAK